MKYIVEFPEHLANQYNISSIGLVREAKTEKDATLNYLHRVIPNRSSRLSFLSDLANDTRKKLGSFAFEVPELDEISDRTGRKAVSIHDGKKYLPDYLSFIISERRGSKIVETQDSERAMKLLKHTRLISN